jgi:predicted KAP-like P-loop ATPase
VEDIEDWFKRYEEFLFKRRSERSEKLSKLREAIEDLKKKKGAKKFVLAIDDLDRLTPERAFKLLEVLYLYFDIPGSIILMAINDSAVNYYVRKNICFLPEEMAQAGYPVQEEFLDKLFPLSVDLQLSRLNDFHLKDFFSDLPDAGEIREELIKLARNIEGLTHRQWILSLNLYEVGFNPESDWDSSSKTLTVRGKKRFFISILRVISPQVKHAYRVYGDIIFEDKDMLKELKATLDSKGLAFGISSNGRKALGIIEELEKLKGEREKKL